MFDLDGHVVGDSRKLAMKRLNQLHGMPYPIKKIRITKRNMLRPSRHLLPNIRQHHVALHNPKHTVVNRHNRAMPAKMLASPASLSRSHNSVPATRQNKMRILSNRRESRPIRHLKLKALKRNNRLTLVRHRRGAACCDPAWLSV